uniref:VOC family protein n=1 Tax=Altererythrobacter segetis TaxID=1104773 RepID=UPI00140E444C|nr:VOC family protein [Altererythrobacter segetis]
MTGMPIWFELMTPDPDAVRDFYRAVVGWDIGPAGMTAGSGQMDYRAIQRGDGGMAGGVLGLSRDMIDGGAKPGWLAYFHVDDVPTAVEKVEQLGGKTWMPTRTMDVGTMAMVADPQGAPFYLMDPIPPADNPDAKSDVWDREKAQHCRWLELETTDEPAATAFYTAMFGWTAENTMPMGDKGVYRFVEHEGHTIGAINPWMPDGMSVSWLPYFGVADIDKAHEAAKNSGGTIRGEVHEVPGGDFIFMANDPAGAAVAFVGPKGE